MKIIYESDNFTIRVSKDGTKIEVAYFKDNHYQNHYIITEENGKSQLYSDVEFPWLKLP